MNPYRVYLTDRLGSRYGKVRASGLSYEHRLGGVGNCDFTLRLDDKLISGINRSNLDHWATEVDIFRNDKPVISGPVFDLEADGTAETITVKAVAATGWLGRREIREDFPFTQVDQADILYALVAYAQDPGYKGPNADARLLVDAALTGVLRDRTYLGAESKKVLDAVLELAAVLDGMDVTLEYDTLGTEVLRILTSHYPSAGVDADAPLRLGKGGLSALTVKRPGDKVATRVHALGNGEGSSQVTYDTPVDPALEARYGVHEHSLSLLDVKETATLAAHAGDALWLRRPPLQVVGAEYDVTAATPFNLANLGDRVRVMADRGWLQVDTRLRVVAKKVTVDEQGNEHVALTLNNPIDEAA